jgi:hypothetical protein
MNKKIKMLLIAVSVLPLCLHLPYLLQAWSGSRLDKLDWIFYLLAIPAAVYAARGEKIGKCDFYALLLLIPMLLLAAGSGLHHINALAVAAGVGVIFAAVWLLTAWKTACRVLPAAVILLMGTPSSSYQLSLLLMCPVLVAWIIKILLAAVCLIWIWCNKHFDWSVKKGTLFFTAALLGSCGLLLHTKELYFEGKSFVPEFTGHVGAFWGRPIQPDENTRRFFAASKVEQFRYSKDNVDISVLAVQCGNNIHEIHPASHCLRTSLWTVNSEEIFYLQDNFAVTEIDAEKGNTRILVWVWYSSNELSTPSFLGFRRHFHVGGNYSTYQISIPVYDNIEQSRNELKEFIKLLQKEHRQ